jgi:hypothetical protein
MKLTVEAKVAASIAAGFVALTVGVIAQGNSGDHSAGPNGYRSTNNPEVSTNMSHQGHDGSGAGRTNGEDNRHRSQWQFRE